jgi:hypothetical protein
MSNYDPRGFIKMYRKQNIEGVQEIYFKFDGPDDFAELKIFAKEKGFTCQPPTLKPTDVYMTADKQTEYQTPNPPCPKHGAGRWVMPNKGRGKHKFYCAFKIGEGEYCGEKIS